MASNAEEIRRCVVPMCTSNCCGGDSGGGTSFFPFPSHEKLRMMWMWSILKPDHSLVCSRHFDESDLVSTGNEGLTLKEYAFPLLNLPQPTSRPLTENVRRLQQVVEADLTTASPQLIDLTTGPSDDEWDAFDEPPESNERTREPADDIIPRVQSEPSTSRRSREVQDCRKEQDDGNSDNIVPSQLVSQSMLTLSLEGVNAAAQKDWEEYVHASIDMDHPYALSKDEAQVKCDLCGLTFASKDTAASHVCFFSTIDQLEVEDMLSSAVPSVKPSDSISDLPVHADAPKEKKPLAGKYRLFVHRFPQRPTPTQERSYVCGICCKSFIRKDAFDVHRSIHTGEKPHLCDVCGKSFRLRFTLKQHYMRHTGEKPYKCDICDRDFRQRSSLDAHRRIHTGEKPFQCDTCGNKFRTASALVEHKTTHKPEKVELKCNSCGKIYLGKTQLKKHKCVAEEGTVISEGQVDQELH